MKAKIAIVSLLCLALLGGAVWWIAGKPATPNGDAGDMSGGMPPATVSTVLASTQHWRTRLKATGEVRAVQGADLSAEVNGIVDRIDFSSGEDVAAGTELLRLRANDDDARLAQLQAQADLASANLVRDRRQFQAQAISRATLDADESTLRSDQAQVAGMRALMAEKIVRAPFAGRLGIRQVDVGQYLTAGTTIVTLQALDPIYVDFNIQQQALGQLKPGQAVGARVDAWPGRVFTASIASINSKVDQASRMVMVRATLDNHDHALVPGMFAIVEILTGEPEVRVTVPQSAISYNPYGNFVYVLAPGKDGGLIAESRVVETGEVRGDQVSVRSGIKPGEQVVTAGQLKLRSGSRVMVNNSVQPSNDVTPEVEDE